MEERKVLDIKVTEGMSVDQLVRSMSDSGGFTAKKLADAIDVVERMVRDEDCLTFLSFPACIMATGTRGVIVELVRLLIPGSPAVAVASYVLHLGVVTTLFLTFPYSKFAHMLYRTLAMIHEQAATPDESA